MSGSRWHALAVHLRSESSALADVRRAVDDAFMPVRVERRAWSDRVQSVEVPLFPGYLFVKTQLSAAVRVKLLKSRHVVDLVSRLPGDERIARAIPDAQISSLQHLCAASRAMDPIERLVSGAEVTIALGPLRGVRGVVQQGPDGHRRLVVQIELLGRGVRTVLSADDVVEASSMSVFVS